MFYKKRLNIFGLTILLSFVVFIFVHNTQKSSFKFFIWNTQEERIGKLIAISFISGFLINILLNEMTFIKEIRSSSINEEDNTFENNEIPNDENNISNTEMPPQRDLSDTQPTISVNYRVVKNADNFYSGDSNEYENNSKGFDDWSNNDRDW